MIDALQVLRFSLADLWQDFGQLVLTNILWSLALFLPLVPLFVLTNVPLVWVLLLILLFWLPLPVISGALCFVTNQIARGKSVGWGTFGYGLRHYWAKSLVVWGINLVALVLFVSNLQFYGVVLEGTWTYFALSAWLVLGIYWLLVQIFWFPMILELENERILLALRNALTMVIITPVFSLSLGVLLLLITVLSIVLTLPLLLFTASWMLLIFNHATRSRLAYVRKEPYQPGMDLD